MGATPLVRIDGLRKCFGATSVLADLSLDIAADTFFALLGPSGCGKTTLLRCLAGFETPDGGRILIDGVDMHGLPAHRRPVNMMFQSYALFPHMDVARNIGFGLRQEGRPKREIAARTEEMVALLALAGLEGRRPDTLSGGQKQRVALARALIKRPKLLLLDEPLAALDRRLREDTQFELMRLQRILATSFVLVTHDQREAMVMAKTVAVMRDGAIEQIGTPAAVYGRPESRWVAGFMGDANILEGEVIHSDTEGCQVATPLGVLVVAGCGSHPSGERVALALRPERVDLASAMEGTAQTAIVESVAFTGDMLHYGLRLQDGTVFRVAAPNGATMAIWPEGARVALSVPAGAATMLRR